MKFLSFFVLFSLFWLIDDFGWFGMENLLKGIPVMLVFSQDAIVALKFFQHYNIILMVLSVIL